MTLNHSFEGATNGATIAAGASSNSDLPPSNYFDNVFRDATGTPGVVAFSNVQVKRGLMAARFASGSVAAFTCVEWDTTSVVDDFVRGYAFLTADYTINQPIFYWESSGFAGQGCVYLMAARTIAIGNASNTVIATSTNTVTLNQWARIEAQHHADNGANAQITVRLFLGANVDGVTPDETLTSPTFTGTAAQTAKDYIGMPFAAASQPPSGFLYMDDIGANGETWLGTTAEILRARRSLMGMKRPVVYTMQGEKRNHLWLPKRKIWKPKLWTPGGELCPA